MFAQPHGETAGPSPHPWGKPGSNLAQAALARTIPTPVGKTRVKPALQGDLTGPSPHPWGKPERVQALAVQVRTIPTPVGKTRGPGGEP